MRGESLACRRRFMRTRWSVPILTFALLGCVDPPVEPTPHGGPGDVISLDVGVPASVRPGEESFAALATTSPSSAGFYFDPQGVLVVRVRDQNDDELAVTAARTLGRNGHAPSRDGRTEAVSARVQRAQYTFRQLAEWRDLALAKVLGSVSGVVSLDLDEGAIV